MFESSLRVGLAVVVALGIAGCVSAAGPDSDPIESGGEQNLLDDVVPQKTVAVVLRMTGDDKRTTLGAPRKVEAIRKGIRALGDKDNPRTESLPKECGNGGPVARVEIEFLGERGTMISRGRFDVNRAGCGWGEIAATRAKSNVSFDNYIRAAEVPGDTLWGISSIESSEGKKVTDAATIATLMKATKLDAEYGGPVKCVPAYRLTYKRGTEIVATVGVCPSGKEMNAGLSSEEEDPGHAITVDPDVFNPLFASRSNVTCGRMAPDRFQLMPGVVNPGSRTDLEGKCRDGYFLCRVPSSQASTWCASDDCYVCMQQGG